MVWIVRAVLLLPMWIENICVFEYSFKYLVFEISVLLLRLCMCSEISLGTNEYDKNKLSISVSPRLQGKWSVMRSRMLPSSWQFLKQLYVTWLWCVILNIQICKHTFDLDQKEPAKLCTTHYLSKPGNSPVSGIGVCGNCAKLTSGSSKDSSLAKARNEAVQKIHSGSA